LQVAQVSIKTLSIDAEADVLPISQLLKPLTNLQVLKVRCSPALVCKPSFVRLLGGASQCFTTLDLPWLDFSQVGALQHTLCQELPQQFAAHTTALVFPWTPPSAQSLPVAWVRHALHQFPHVTDVAFTPPSSSCNLSEHELHDAFEESAADMEQLYSAAQSITRHLLLGLPEEVLTNSRLMHPPQHVSIYTTGASTILGRDWPV
jgi:hypothetical protein